jgi:tetratricopeptide (TPR) repeat protein
MFDQLPRVAAGDCFSVPLAKHARSESTMSSLKLWHRAALLVVLAGLAVSLLVWIAHSNPVINYLPRYRGADWIVFPAAVDARGRSVASLDATFRREFVVNNRPATARLSIRAMRRADVKINGNSVLSVSNRDWKPITTVDIAGQLQGGTNSIEARVFNDTGPPALWLNVTSDQSNLRTDDTWQVSIAGSSWRSAALASAAKAPRSGNLIAGGIHTLDAIRRSWPFWIVLVTIACTMMLVWQLAFKESITPRAEKMLVLVLAALWLLLFWNNASLLPFHLGFDSKFHLAYVDYIQKHRSLPLPTEGFEMYQPPLYYSIAAGILSACKLSITDAAAVVVLRGLGLFLGTSAFVLVFLSLRLLLPPASALIGLLMAAFLPMQLYLGYYVTNEMLAAALAALGLYLCLRLLKSETPRLSQFGWLGFVIGAAMLSKATGILLLPIVIVTIIGKMVYARAPVATLIRNLCLLLLVCFAVCGWYYGRIWLKFGTPLVGNWDAISGFRWWQDPGYHTVDDYVRFGRSLVNPLFSSFAGFADAIYSTLWGDGMCGGVSSVDVAWNEYPMVAGYFWAVVPSIMILAGAIVALVRLIRKPSSELFLLVGFSGLILIALIFMTLRVPSYAQAKAFYGLSALTPLCFFGALGWEILTTGNRGSRIALGALLLVWAMNSFGGYWIIPSARHDLFVAEGFATAGEIERATAEATKAMDADPSDTSALGFHAEILSESGHPEEAIKEAERAIQLNPDNSDLHFQLAMAAVHIDMERAITEARRAIDLGPENSLAYQFLSDCLLRSRRYNEVIEVGREWLTVTPRDAAAHSALASAFVQNGELIPAAHHLGYMMMLQSQSEQAYAEVRKILLSLLHEPNGLDRLRELAATAPDSPRMLDELAWLLATYPDSNLRDGTEAVRLAERACALTQRQVPSILDTLGAAYAESGDFQRAIDTTEEALKRAHSSGDSDAITLSENILAVIRENMPYRQKPE